MGSALTGGGKAGHRDLPSRGGLVVLDPGHGGRDPGAIGFGVAEKTLTLEIGRQIRQSLLAVSDLDVALTREDDAYIAPAKRARWANDLGADCFVSLHVNAFDGRASGFESFVSASRDAPGSPSLLLQEIVHGEVMSSLRGYGVADRGRRRADFQVLALTDMPAVLVELLFIDHRRDHALVCDPTFQKLIADSCASGIASAARSQLLADPDRLSPPRGADDHPNEHPHQRGAGARTLAVARKEPPAARHSGST